MTAISTVTQRADLDILEDVEHLITTYPPSRKDQHAIRVRVTDGQVSLEGHVQTPVTRRYLLEVIPRVDGVASVEAEALYDDETLRLEVGKVIPAGVVVARIQYGTAILSGRLPGGMSAAELEARVKQVAGVKQVVTSFR